MQCKMAHKPLGFIVLKGKLEEEGKTRRKKNYKKVYQRSLEIYGRVKREELKTQGEIQGEVEK